MKIDEIENGIVFDHIAAGKGMEVYNTLRLDKLKCQVAIIQNAKSEKMGAKDIIKINELIDINLDEKFMIVDIDDSHVKYEFEDVLTTIMHSWVVTTYKAQGSEYKVVLAIVDKSATFQLNANLLYTAFSRAKEYMLILGQSRTLNIALGKFANLQRRCFLSDFLKIAYVVQKNPDKSLDSLLNG